MTAWLFSGDLAFLATPHGSRGVTSPKNTTMKQSPHRFVFCGHDGRGLAMTPMNTLFCVLQDIFQIGASTATSVYTCGDRSDIIGVYQLRPDYTVDQMTACLFSGNLALLATPPASRGVTAPETTNIQKHLTAWLFSGDLALLATPPGSRDVTSRKNTTIKEAPHRFVFCGHDGRGLAMTPTRTLFCVLQGIFLIGASRATSAYTCVDRNDIVGVYQLRADYTVDQLTAWLFSGDLALLATPPGSRGVTSPKNTTIKEAPHRAFPDRRIYSNERLHVRGLKRYRRRYQLRPDYTVDHMTAWLFSGDLALLATPPGSRFVTSPETTNIHEARHRFVFCGHDGRGLAMTLTRTLFCVLQGIFLIGTSTAASAYTDMALLATRPGGRGVTSPETTNIQEAPHRFEFCGHDGRGLAMTLTRTLFCVRQAIFQIGASTATNAYTCGHRSDIVGDYQLRPDYTVDQMTAWLFSGDLALLATPPGSRGVTSPETTDIQEAPHRFVFCGHDGRGLAMTLTRTLFCVLQSIFQIGASTATSAYTCGHRSDIVGVYQLRPDYTVDQMTAWLFSDDLALLATPPGSRGVTSPKNTTIKQAPHQFAFCGHNERGLKITPTRTLFCDMQGIFLIGASTATSAYTCVNRNDIVGVYQLRPDYIVDQMTALLFSRDLALLATRPGSRGVTSPETTNIQQAPHRFVICGHD
ncbi:hypothetical protein V5799_028571 [Amblyomma americanum]|uniref:Uncharacterized protein n=1 Tax=Amblyomma americanum TaxID=6943 RepID=A0AAQ4DCJ4_AMBAM